MRCAACNHRWTIGLEEPEAVLPEVAPDVPPAAPPPDIDPADAEPASDISEDGPPASSHFFRTVVAITLGAALAIGAGAVWVTRIDPGAFPLFGDELAAIIPGTLPLHVEFTAGSTALPSGDRLLQISGHVSNTGKTTIILPDLEARLAGPDGTVRRWRIAAPVPKLAPGQSVAFVSTATGFPADATIVGIRPAG